MKKISNREALIFICENFINYARAYDDYDDGYGLEQAIKAVNRVDGDITAEDVRGIATHTQMHFGRS
jgi:hypothetical protein